ncbi:MAG: hypothetical protein JNK72_08300 [Myxococcales bacterium]|nr:hypothetical protein [Myxococcales bacterium]
MSEDPIRFSRGGSATVEAADNTHVTLRATLAFPPGAPAEGEITHNGGTHRFVLKVSGSMREGDRWRVRARHTGASSAVRAAFVAHLAAPPGP